MDCFSGGPVAARITWNRAKCYDGTEWPWPTGGSWVTSGRPIETGSGPRPTMAVDSMRGRRHGPTERRQIVQPQLNLDEFLP